MDFKLTLQPKLARLQRHNVPQVRELHEHLEALGAKAQAVGIPTTEALRQIIAHFVENPFDLDPGKTFVGDRASGATATFHMDGATYCRFLELIEGMGVTFPNAMRQLIRKFLEVS